MIGIGEPPLVLQSGASVASAGAGQEYSYTIQVASSSAATRAVEVRVDIDSQLELRGATANSGSCGGGTMVACKLSVRRGHPASITIAVRIRPNAAPASRIVWQALAQDDLNNTAASDRVVVAIAAPLPALQAPPRPTLDGPPPRPIISSNRVTQLQVLASAPNIASQSSASLSNDNVAVGGPAAVLAPPPAEPPAVTASGTDVDPSVVQADSWLPVPVDEPASTGSGLSGLETQAQVLAEPSIERQPRQLQAPHDQRAAPQPEPRLLVLLPDTAAVPPTIGIVSALIGLALIVHGVRRVRRAAMLLEQQRAAISRLVALLGATALRGSKPMALDIPPSWVRTRDDGDAGGDWTD
jgi:hypothetical protein